MDKKFKVGDNVICRESHLGEPVWVTNMDGTVGKKLVVEKVSSTSGHLGCRSENADWYWYEPQWLEPYPKKRRAPKVFKVGDLVICKEKHDGEQPWGGRCDTLVGKPMTVVAVNDYECVECVPKGNPLGERNTVWKTKWLEAYTEFKVGDIVICRKKGKVTNAVDWHLLMDRTIGKPMVVVGMSTDGYPRCRADGDDLVWTYLPEWLEPYKEFKVGDIVICKKRQENAVTARWVDRMDDTIGKPMKIVEISPSGNLHCKIEGGNTWAYVPEWIEHYTEKGNEEVKKDGNNLSPIVVDENVYYGIKEIISNPAKRATTVIFNDGKKICVKAGRDVERPDIYSAVTAAIGIHFAGSNNALKTIIKKKTTELKPKRKGTRKEFTIEAGDLVKLTKRAKKEAAFPADAHDGENHPHFKVRIEDTDREMLVAKVEDGIVYANVPERIKDYDYKIPVEFLRITRKGE